MGMDANILIQNQTGKLLESLWFKVGLEFGLRMFLLLV